MKKNIINSIVSKPKLLFICLLVLTLLPISAYAVPVSLGTAASFGVLSGSTVTNTGSGSSVITGNLGVSPGTAITGFFGTVENDGPGIVNGIIHEGDATAALAQSDLTTAYNNLAALPFNTHYLVPTDLGGATLTAGVYKFDSSAGLTGTLTLSGPGDFVFQIGSTLTTAGTVLTIDGADAGNVYWAVGSSATLGTNTAFKGSILALASIGIDGLGTLDGRALAKAAVTISDAETINVPTTVPEPATLCLLGLGGLAMMRKRRA